LFAVGSDLEGPEEEQEDNTKTVVIIASVGAVLLALTVATGVFMYKNRKLYFQ